MQNQLTTCLDLLYAAQKERGFARLYLRGKEPREAQGFLNHAAGLDVALVGLSSLTLPQPIAQKKDRLLEKARALPRWREEILHRETTPETVIENYAQDIIIPILLLTSELLIHEKRTAPNRVGSLAYLLHLQEQMALERELSTLPPEPDEEADETFIEKLKDIIAEQQAYERLFWTLADESQRQIYASVRTSHASGNLGDDINMAVMEGRPLPMLRFYTALEWFTIFSVKIDALRDAAHKLLEHLTDDTPEINFASSGNQPLDTDLEGHFDIIKNLPLFKGISSTILRSLLRGARLTTHEKNTVILVQGEPCTRFGIILEGWVKLFKSSETGEESILQIIGKKDCLLESDFLTTRIATSNARTVARTKILHIPSSSLHEHALRDPDLSQNLLRAAFQRNQKLASHFEQVTLKTAAERVGRFLLDLHIEGGSTGSPLRLPFDKALIAAYLHIKPETFSRILQNLRKQGFRIDKQTIYMPSAQALCSFCDPDQALRCCNALVHHCLRSDQDKERPSSEA